MWKGECGNHRLRNVAFKYTVLRLLWKDLQGVVKAQPSRKKPPDHLQLWVNCCALDHPNEVRRPPGQLKKEK